MNSDVICTGNELESVLEGIRGRKGFPDRLEACVGGHNAAYRVSYFERAAETNPTQQERGERAAMDPRQSKNTLAAGENPAALIILPTAPKCSSGQIQSRPFPARPVKVMESAGHNAQTNTSVAAGNENRAEKPKSVNDAPASIFESVEERKLGHIEIELLTGNQPSKPGLPMGSSPNALTNFGPSTAKPAQDAPCGSAAVVGGPSIEDRMAALQAKMFASGNIRRSKPSTPQEHARLPHPND